MRDLSPRQADVLRVLGRSLAERHYMPTIREIAVAIGIRPASASCAATDHLNRLEAKGYLHREYGKSRAIALTEKAFAFLDAQTSEPQEGKLAQAEDAAARA